MKFFSILVAILFPLVAFGQQPQTPEEQDRELRESIDKDVERFTNLYDLEIWQAFYLDSILYNNTTQRNAEIRQLQSAKVSQSDIYYRVSDKWAEETYNAIHKILNEDQWASYLKSGAAREKKARDKREAKRNK